MSVYGPLAQWYDALTRDVPYAALAAEVLECPGDGILYTEFRAAAD